MSAQAQAEHGPSPVWMVRAGQHGEDEVAALEGNLAIIGFHSIPDLSSVRTVEEILGLVRMASPNDKESRSENRARQLAAFVLRMKQDDVVALPLKGSGSVALGRVTGSYAHREVNGEKRHTRPVKWVRTDVPRNEFGQDLLYSLGAFMTVCQIQRNDAQRRFAAMLAGGADPGPGEEALAEAEAGTAMAAGDTRRFVDVAQVAQDQVVTHIQARFSGHALARLVEAVLQAEGYFTRRSPEGPDGGVDILAGRGSLGLDEPSLCVQVKSSSSPSDVNILRALKGTMQSFGARQGLLVSWGGYTRPTLSEARQSFFSVRLWSASDLVEAIYRTYDRLPEEIQAELPLKRGWTLVPEDLGE